MEHQIYEKLSEEGSIVPIPLIAIGVGIAMPAVILGAMLTAVWNEVKEWGH
jgi:hypothetical protein